MRIKQKVAYFLITAFCSLSFVSNARATALTSLSLSNTTGDTVQVQITGASNSSIQLSYLLSGASALTSVIFGATDGSGNFSTSISSGGYGIPAGSPVFATINGVQSGTALWPSYTSSLSFSQTNVQIAVGQSVTISASKSLVLELNNATADIGTSVSGSQVIITGLDYGLGTLTFCSSNVGCGSISVEVGSQSGQSQVSLDQSSVSLYVGQAKSVSVLSGSHNGYIVSSNSNSAALHATLTRTSDIVWIYGDAPGTATLVICSIESSTNCANLTVTVLNTSSTALSFSQNDLLLSHGLTQTVTVSGGPNSSYYILSNSNSSVAAATISGNLITIKGGTYSGSNVITVCSTSVNNTCGSLNVTLVDTSTNASSITVLSFDRNVVSVARGDTSNVIVSGGDGTGYSVSSNSAPGIATASINGTGSSIALYGSSVGSSIITICSASASTVCASLYVTITPALSPIVFSGNYIALTSGGKFIITISGGSGTNTVYSNSNSDAVSASLTSSGNVVLLVGGTVSGSSTIIVCPTTTYNSQCANLYATNTAVNVTATSALFPVAGDLIKASTAAIYYLGSNGKRYVFPNEKTYKTWYSDFSSVKTITDAQLASYIIGGNVTYKPGVKMVKITSDPDVYAVDAYGKLRLIKSESAATAIYGKKWAQMVEDIPDAFFVNYTMGTDINSASDFYRSSVSAAVKSINYDKSLSQ